MLRTFSPYWVRKASTMDGIENHGVRIALIAKTLPPCLAGFFSSTAPEGFDRFLKRARWQGGAAGDPLPEAFWHPETSHLNQELRAQAVAARIGRLTVARVIRVEALRRPPTTTGGVEAADEYLRRVEREILQRPGRPSVRSMSRSMNAAPSCRTWREEG